MQIFLGIPLKWIIRLLLALFYIAGVWLHLQGNNFFGWLTQEHPNITVGIVFLTIMSFVSPFFHVKQKTSDGGEKVLRKLTAIIWIIVATVIAISLACAFDDGFKASVVGILTGIGGVAYTSTSTAWSNFATTIGTSGTYFLIYTLSILIVGGVVFVALTRIKRSGKLSIRHKEMSTSDLSTGVGTVSSKSTTPAGATVRPKQTETNPTSKTAETVEIEE